MRIFYLLLTLLPMLASAQVTEYLGNIRTNGKTAETPSNLWETADVAVLVKQLQPYAFDTIADVSDEAYYIVFMAGSRSLSLRHSKKQKQQNLNL